MQVLLFAAVFAQIRSFSANFCYFVGRASVLGAMFVYVLAIWAKIRLRSCDCADRVAEKSENRKSAGYAVPAILS